MSRWCAGLILLSVASVATAQVEADWTRYPGFFRPGYAGIATADLDGDGHDEAIVSGTGGGSYAPLSSNFLAVLSYDGGTPSTFRVSYLRHVALGETLVGTPAKARPIGASHDDIYATVQDASGTRLLRFGGAHLDPISSITVPASFRLAGVADLDADGQLEAYGVSTPAGASGYAATVLDAATGAVEWIDSNAHQYTTIAAGQLDGDPALELVVSGTPGRVIDGATHAVDWSYPAGFPDGAPIAIGNFRGTTADREFAVVSSNGSLTGTAQIFSTSPSYGLASTFAVGQVQVVGAVDVNGDQVDELVVGEGQSGGVNGYSTSNGSLAFSLPGIDSGTSAIATGDLDGKPGMELVYGSGLDSTGRDVLRVVSLAAGTPVLFESADEGGPHSSVALADLDQDGFLEAIYASRESNSAYDGPDLVIADALTGVTLRRKNGVLRPTGGNPGPSIRVANLDADLQPEIIIGLGSFYTAEVIALDGLNLATQWDVMLGNGVVYDLALLPTVGGPPNVVAAIGTNLLQFAGGQAVLLDGASGNLMWRSAAFQQSADPRLAIGNFDDDAASEVALSIGTTIAFLDAASGMTDRQQLAGGTLIGQWAETVDGVCYHIQVLSTELNRYRCNDGQFLSKRSFAVPVTYVDRLSNSFGTLVMSDGQRALLESGGVIVEQSVVLGQSMGWGDRGAFVAGPGGTVLLIGGSDSVSRVSFTNFMFADSFE